MSVVFSLAVGFLLASVPETANPGPFPRQPPSDVRLVHPHNPIVEPNRAPARLGPALLRSLRTRPSSVHRFLALGLDESDIARAEGIVRARIGPVISAEASNGAILALRARAQYIESPASLRPRLDESRAAIHAGDTDEGHGFERAYRGRGSLVAAYDTGVDLLHPDFLDTSQTTRVHALWIQPDGDGPDRYCDRAMLAAGACAAHDIAGHGTHVLSIAAGNGSTYRGVAPESDVVLAQSALFDDLVGALAWFHGVATAKGAPMVVNLSLGGHIGPHDGTSLEARAMEAFSHLVVAAAGNEGDEPIHARIDLDATASVAVAFDFRDDALGLAAIVDVWGESDDGEVVAEVGVVKNDAVIARSGTVAIGDVGRSLPLVVSGVRIATIDIDSEPTRSPLNDLWHLQVVVTRDDAQMDGAGRFFVRLAGTGRFDAWIDAPASVARAPAFSAIREPALVAQAIPDSAISISDPATAPSVIAVSSFVTKNELARAGRLPIKIAATLGALSRFNSHGPTRDPMRTGPKPDLAAPGQAIVAASSRDAVVSETTRIDDLHKAGAGTSMAAPHVAGVAALVLEVAPSLTKRELRDVLLDSADASELANGGPDLRWGRGKLDAGRALELAGAPTSCGCRATAASGKFSLGSSSVVGLSCLLVARRLSRRSCRARRRWVRSVVDSRAVLRDTVSERVGRDRCVLCERIHKHVSILYESIHARQPRRPL